MNTQIRQLYGLFALLFAVLVGFTSYWAVVDAEGLEDNPDNRRALIEEQTIPRGLIYARDGRTVLARNRVVRRGGTRIFVREYPPGGTFAHPIGYSFIENGRRSLELSRNDDYYQSLALSGLDTRENTGKDPQDEAVVPNLLTRMQSFDPSNLERGQRAVGVLQTVRSLSEFLESVRGRRKALLWFSEGIDYPMAEAFSSQSGNEIFVATRDAISAAAQANVNVFALDPRGLIGMATDFVDNMRAGAPDVMGTDRNRPVGTPSSGTQALLGEMRLTQDSLRTMADSTGGFAAVDTNSFAEAFNRITDANSRYYLLGYAPPAHPRDGRFPSHRSTGEASWPYRDCTARLSVSERQDHGRAEAGGARALDARAPWRRVWRHVPGDPRGIEQPCAAAWPDAWTHRRAVQGNGEGSFRRTRHESGIGAGVKPQPNGLFADTLEVSFFALNDDGRAQRGTRSALNLAVRPETYRRVKRSGSG